MARIPRGSPAIARRRGNPTCGESPGPLTPIPSQILLKSAEPHLYVDCRRRGGKYGKFRMELMRRFDVEIVGQRGYGQKPLPKGSPMQAALPASFKVGPITSRSNCWNEGSIDNKRLWKDDNVRIEWSEMRNSIESIEVKRPSPKSEFRYPVAQKSKDVASGNCTVKYSKLEPESPTGKDAAETAFPSPDKQGDDIYASQPYMTGADKYVPLSLNAMFMAERNLLTRFGGFAELNLVEKVYENCPLHFPVHPEVMKMWIQSEKNRLHYRTEVQRMFDERLGLTQSCFLHHGLMHANWKMVLFRGWMVVNPKATPQQAPYL